MGRATSESLLEREFERLKSRFTTDRSANEISFDDFVNLSDSLVDAILKSSTNLTFSESSRILQLRQQASMFLTHNLLFLTLSHRLQIFVLCRNL